MQGSDDANAFSALHQMPLVKAAQLLRNKSLSPVELTRACLDRIEALNPVINAFITVTAESALEEAHEAETEIGRGDWRGPLHGIPIALKDLIDTAGVRTTAGSALFANRVPQQDAEVVRRLKEAGAVLIGKTNLHEFAYGGSSVVSHFGAVRNPHNPAHIAGGSSGGSAAALAAGMCLGAIGTDTAGSIRLPAAFCGVTGFKPSYGLVSARGVIPLAWSYDHVGPIARTVEDAAIMLQTIAGYDAGDLFSKEIPLGDYACAVQAQLKLVRVGVAREMFWAELDGEIAAALERALARIAPMAVIKEVMVPIEPDRDAASAESFAYHANSVAEHPEKYQPSTLQRIRSGESITAAAYIKARQRLERMRRAAPSLFEEVDVIVSPTSPVLPPTIAELECDPANLRRREVVMLRNTRLFNVLGLPAISIWCGQSARGLPIGLQVAGAPHRDAQVLAVAAGFERMLSG